jgi:hypothetical protein
VKQVLDHIDESQGRLANHPFFGLLTETEPLANVLNFVPLATFWVMSFQDALRLNAGMITNPQLLRIARHHREEDSGHDRWFLDDLRLVDGVLPDVETLYGAAHQPVRDVTYALMAESFRAVEDVERVALLLILESTGQVFFPRVVEYFRSAGIEADLRYFAQTHLDVEKNHEIVEQQMHDTLAALEVSAGTVGRCVAAVDRCYAAFGRLFDAFADAVRTVEADGHRRRNLRGRMLASAN